MAGRAGLVSRLAPGAVVALALLLNLVGATWGLPARWHPDEKADAAERMLAAGTLRPESFINPSLPLYLQMPVLWLQARAAETGLLSGRATDPLLAGRLLAALAGAGAVLLLAAWGADGRGQRLLAAALLATAPGVVNLCHFATPEPWLLLGAAATVVLAWRHAEGRAPAWPVGIVLGLTASTKYTAAALAVPCLAAALLAAPRPWRRRDGVAWVGAGAVALAAGLALALGADLALAGRLGLRDVRLLHPESAFGFVRTLEALALAAGAALLAAGALALLRPAAWPRRVVRAEVIVLLVLAAAAFLVGTPGALLEPRAFLSDLAFNQQTRHEYKGLVGAATSFFPYLSSWSDAVTWPVLAAAALGGLVALGRAARGDRRPLVVLAAALAPYLLVASSGHRAMRFLVPALPATAMLAALALRAIPAPRLRGPAAGLVVARAAVAAVLVVRLFFVDARLLAARWIAAHVPAWEAVDMITNNPGYGPSLPPGRARIVPTLSREMAPDDRFREAAARYPTEAAPWLVLPAAYYERFLDHPDQAPERARFFRALLDGRTEFEVVARFRQQGWLRPDVEFVDPEVVILHRR